MWVLARVYVSVEARDVRWLSLSWSWRGSCDLPSGGVGFWDPDPLDPSLCC